MHRCVAVPVKDDRGHPARGLPRRVEAGALHGRECGRQISRHTGRQPRMHARGGEQVGIGARQDGGHRTARRQACHVRPDPAADDCA
ncbi:hypothetical protein G6F50_017020 [Rhizopus delemar]|uniref:Uncharacterized protein n=1 Tax=Rhizopus delemar TaxID=936053 RepID=A0A9P6XRE0_9FUNG|nr:hypothetical protein G6F50_017020 [Rhizopus delemar]